MAEKSLREELESAFDAEDRKVKEEARGRMNRRQARADSSIFGSNDKAGAMGEPLRAFGTEGLFTPNPQKTRDEAARKAYDAVQNIDESMVEDAEHRIKSRSKGWEAARSALMKAKGKK